jgi:hypothetical protein
MATGRPNLSTSGRGPSVNFFGNDGPFDERAWVKVKNYIPEEFDLSPSGTTVFNYGQTTIIEVDKRADLWGKTELVFTRAALGAGGTNPRFVDWEGPLHIANVRFMYSTKMFHEVFGEQILWEQFQEDDEATLNGKAALQNGFTSVAERITKAASSAQLTVNLRVPWENMKKMINMVAVPNKIRVEITWNTLAKIVQADASASAITAASNPISAVSLKCQFYHMQQDERNRRFAMVNAPKGLAKKISTVEYHLRENIATVASAPSTIKIPCRNIKNDTYKIVILLRLQADVDGTNTTGAFPQNIQLPDQVYMEDNGARITKIWTYTNTITGNTAPSYNLYTDNVEQGMKNPQMATFPFIILEFCHNKLMDKQRDDSFGSRGMGKYNNPQFVLVFNSTTTGAIYFDAWAYVHNIVIEKQGDVRKFLL